MSAERLRSVVLATAREVPGLLDGEGALLRDALHARGVGCEPGVWDDPGVDWAATDLVVVRSTWDYAARRAEFLAWAADVGRRTTLLNPLPLLAWNTDKHYLVELAAAGVPVVPSHVLEPGDDDAHPLLAAEHVVKPCVSAGSKDTLRLGPDDAERSRAHARGLLERGRSVLVQPYLPDVDTAGETALVFVDGVYSHAARKGPLLTAGADPVAGLFAEEDIRPREPAPAERAVAERVVTGVLERFGPVPPLYARVDLLPTADGPLLLELELTEPSLFLDLAESAVERFADAVVARLGVRGGAGRP